MELAIPFLALGGMYIISNAKKKRVAAPEEFENMGQSTNYLPNVNVLPKNYPVLNETEIDNSVQHYPNPNAATDKYFNQNTYENRVQNKQSVGNNMQDIHSLTGGYVNTDEFKHNNMVPFNGRKVRGSTYNSSVSESVLDNMNGSGSQYTQKAEQAPLFKPEDNMSWTHGAPNQNDFFQSRVNPGMKINNVKPFESEYVGPGLNKGFSAEGSGGFNSGMDSRDKWLPPTVDELRVVTNPKLEYELSNHEGPASSYIKNIGLMGKMEKNLPDTYFENTKDRWLTTTGQEKGQTLRSIQEQGIVKRPNNPDNYTGSAGPGHGEKAYIKGNYEQSTRIQNAAENLSIASSMGKGPSGNVGDKQSYKILKNNRSYTSEQSFVGGISGAIGAVIAPIMDFVRPSLKEETVANVRIFGDVSTRVPESYVFNPADKTTTTIKETTMYAPTFNINNQKEGTYLNNYTPLENNQRATTLCEYTGIAGSDFGERNYGAEYRQHNNEVKPLTIHNRINQGGTQMFNQTMNLTTQKSDTSICNNRDNAPTKPASIPSKERQGVLNHGRYEQSYDSERINTSLLDAFKKNPYTHSLSSIA
tara:strand:+ start:617 stop:2377 length:1761 start_codon:yes stop_codon:yes gene_type:complete